MRCSHRSVSVERHRSVARARCGLIGVGFVSPTLQVAKARSDVSASMIGHHGLLLPRVTRPFVRISSGNLDKNNDNIKTSAFK